jgi:NO-binding membrane sensor protein with MHYT domain
MQLVTEVHHFAFGWFNPLAAYLMSFLGCLLGLVCTGRARALPEGRRRLRWLVLASIAIGGGGIWLMHFMAMLGFDVPASVVRYDPVLTTISLIIAVLTVGVGLFLVGWGRRSAVRVILGGAFTGLGVVSMHYIGMAAMNLNGVVGYDQDLVEASIIIAIVSATVALWFTVTVRGTGAVNAAAAVMALGVCGMHYTAMAAIRVEIFTTGDGRVSGISPFTLFVPITMLAMIALLVAAVSGLAAMTQEEFSSPSRRRL